MCSYLVDWVLHAGFSISGTGCKLWNLGLGSSGFKGLEFVAGIASERSRYTRSSSAMLLSGSYLGG